MDELDRVQAKTGFRGAVAGTSQHRFVDVDRGDRVAGCRERDRETAGAGGQLEDRAVGPVGQRPIQVEIARILLQVEVVQARERASRLLIRGLDHPAAGSHRTGVPAALRTASALMASRAARFAAIAVVSAWS